MNKIPDILYALVKEEGRRMRIQPAPPTEIMDALLKKSELTVQEAAQLLRVSPPTAFRLYNEGELRGWRLTAAKNSPIRIYTDSVVKYITHTQGREVGKKARA